MIDIWRAFFKEFRAVIVVLLFAFGVNTGLLLCLSIHGPNIQQQECTYSV